MGHYYYGRGSRGNLRRYIMPGVEYLLLDRFDSALAAGSVNGTLAEPGPGKRFVTDTGNNLSIAAGVLNFGGTAVPYDPGDWYAAVARTAGRVLLAELSITSLGGAYWGFDTNQAGSVANCFLFGASGANLRIRDYEGASAGPDIAIVPLLPYEFALILRATGQHYFIRGGAFTEWTLLWSGARNALLSLYPGTTQNNAFFTVDDMRIPDVLWTPTPLASDAFTRANGALGTTGGGAVEEEGGAGLTWVFDSGIWVVDTNQAKGTPTQGSELWDAPAAAFTSGTYAWAARGGNTIANDANELKITYVDRVEGAIVYLRDSDDLGSDLTVGTWYLFTLDRRVNAGKAARILVYDGVATISGAVFTNVTMENEAFIFRAISTTGCFVRQRDLGGTDIVWIDNLSLKPLTLSTLFTSLEISTADVLVEAEVTLTARTQAGIVTNLDDAATPANFVLAYHDGTNAKLDKCVAGVYTSVISAAATYAAGAVIRVVKDGTAYSLYYNNAKIGSTSTISDAGIVDNVLHGLFSTYSANRLDDFVVWARGTSGEYAELEQW